MRPSCRGRARRADPGASSPSGRGPRMRSAVRDRRHGGRDPPRALLGQPLVGAGLEELADPQAARCSAPRAWSAARGWCRPPCRRRPRSPARRGTASRSCAAAPGSGPARPRSTWTSRCSGASSSDSAMAASRSSTTATEPCASHAAPATSAVGHVRQQRVRSPASTACPSRTRGGDQHGGRRRAVLGLAEQVGGDELGVGAWRRR